MYKNVHYIVVNLFGNMALWTPRKQYKFNAKEWHQNEGGSDSFHVEIGFRLVGDLQLGDQNPNNVQQEKEIHLLKGSKWIL